VEGPSAQWVLSVDIALSHPPATTAVEPFLENGFEDLGFQKP